MSKRSWIKIIPYGLLALFTVLVVYDPTLDASQLENTPVTQIADISTQELSNNKIKELHVVKSGENLSVIFEKYSVSLNTTYQIFRKDKSGEVKNIQPGNRLEFIFIGSELQLIRIIKSPVLEFQIFINPSIEITKIEKTPEQIISFKSGIIQSSFYLAGLKADIPESVIMDLAYIFGWDIDFVFDIRANDKFRIMYETPFVDGVKVANGSILFAEFYNDNKKYSAIRFNGKNKLWDYFDDEGNSLEKAFLRAPLDFAYVSSHFNPNRRHPILNKIRAHNGVDYAAKRNTPIRATGEGVIESVGWKSGYGRTVVIRHGGDISTLYAHMEKYQSSLVKGSKIKQGQTIGYVGDSGLATAPHLHYEFKIGNKRSDPLKVLLPSALPLKKSLMPEFQRLQSEYLKKSNNFLSRDPNAKFFE
ncbi:M23 family metallopeptidase [Gammaproteobacteria bacterium]|nr:M23 family metallopeptidase [Gammaproteobacteria bacterium]MDC1483972.1 M23 family metallopeptidase [Gammaproteobacteria bacterium]